MLPPFESLPFPYWCLGLRAVGLGFRVLGFRVLGLGFRVFEDLDAALLSRGAATNTWSVGRPTYDLEYADDTLLISLTNANGVHLPRT